MAHQRALSSNHSDAAAAAAGRGGDAQPALRPRRARAGPSDASQQQRRQTPAHARHTARSGRRRAGATGRVTSRGTVPPGARVSSLASPGATTLPCALLCAAVASASVGPRRHRPGASAVSAAAAGAPAPLAFMGSRFHGGSFAKPENALKRAVRPAAAAQARGGAEAPSLRRRRAAGGADQRRPEERRAAGAARRHHVEGEAALHEPRRAAAGGAPCRSRRPARPPASGCLGPRSVCCRASRLPGTATRPAPAGRPRVRAAPPSVPSRPADAAPQRHRAWTKTSEKIMLKFVECVPRARSRAQPWRRPRPPTPALTSAPAPPPSPPGSALT